MKLKTQWIHHALTAAAFLAALLFVGAPVVRADEDCQKRIGKADHKLHEAIEHHGPQSVQAEHWRHELAEARAYCYEHERRWWDEDAHRWHTDRDWDDHDHDHDFDRQH
jgi:hypothetical protein